jgi:pimeloyl-ACP methyl ester carboxylesterase
MRRLAAALLFAASLVPVVGHADVYEQDLCPIEPTREFPVGFVLPVDRQALACAGAAQHWNDSHVGGWGGDECPADHIPRTPVVFVHGNTGDGWFWRADPESSDGTILNVRQRLLDAGYCERELWAITYSGDAAPRGTYGSGYTTYNEINAEETFEFLAAVRRFTGAPKVDVVAHSLGVTVVRKAMYRHRNEPAENNPYAFVRRAVMIAGGNHGTTGCRFGVILKINKVCEETDPMSPWLAELNAFGESPGSTLWMSICDCSGLADGGFLLIDAESPLLAGSIHVRLPYNAHNTLARGKVALDEYVPFLLNGNPA